MILVHFYFLGPDKTIANIFDLSQFKLNYKVYYLKFSSALQKLKYWKRFCEMSRILDQSIFMQEKGEEIIPSV